MRCKRVTTAGHEHPMKIKKLLARTIVTDFHGEEAARVADENWAKMFQQKETAEDLDEVLISYAAVAGSEPNQIRLPKLLVALGLAASRRRGANHQRLRKRLCASKAKLSIT